MRSPLAGSTRALLVGIIAAVAALVGLPSAALAAPAPAVPVAPIDGATVVGDAELTWTATGGTGYEVRWNADGALAADGALDPATGGSAFPAATSHQLAGLVSPMYHWQVRALPDGAWSSVATFYVDVQLDTLGPGPVPETPAEAAPVPRPDAAPTALVARVDGVVWVAAASGLAALILAVVGLEWMRLRRQQET